MAGAEARVLWQRVATKRCLIHEDVKHSPKLPHMTSDGQGEKTHLGPAKATEEKDLVTLSDSWSTLSSECSPGKKSNMLHDSNSTVHYDYRSGLDDSFMFRFSKSDEFDSLKAADISLGNFSDLQLQISREADPPELVYNQRLMPDEHLEKTLPGSVCLKLQNAEEGKKISNFASQTSTKHESEVDGVIGLEEEQFLPSSSDAGECLSRSQGAAATYEGSKHLQSQGKVSWRTAGTVELAALVAKKSLEHMENCDLPPSRSFLTQKGEEGCDLSPSTRHRWDVSQSMDRDILFPFLYGRESVPPKTKKLAFFRSLSHSDPLPVPNHVPQSLKSLPDVPKKKSSFMKQEQFPSSETRILRSSTDYQTIEESSRGPQLLFGEALCRSQTRAREAEKAAAQALHDKERLARLLFREASRSLTYRQLIDALQAENMCLRLHAGDRSNGRMKKTSSYSTINLFPNACCKYTRKELMRKETQHHCSISKYKWSSGKADAMAGYSIGLAFAFGLSLAGAGLVLGWTMGWILFAPLSN